MKLPLGKKERLQILAIALIVVIGAIWAAVQFVVLPMSKSRREAKLKIGEYEQKLKEGDAEIGSATGADEDARSIKATLREIDEEYVLKPEYDNYMIRAQACVDRIMADCGVSIDSLNMVGKQDMPPPKKGSKPAMSAFVVEVTAKASYEALIKLLERIDNESPYFLMSSPKMSGGADPLVHTVTFRLHWPIWNDPKIVSSFTEQPQETADGKKLLRSRS